MQKMATRVFMLASIAFGIVGILFAMTLSVDDSSNGEPSDLNEFLFKLLASIGFVVLSSFALSVAGKYLASDEQSD